RANLRSRAIAKITKHLPGLLRGGGEAPPRDLDYTQFWWRCCSCKATVGRKLINYQRRLSEIYQRPASGRSNTSESLKLKSSQQCRTAHRWLGAVFGWINFDGMRRGATGARWRQGPTHATSPWRFRHEG